jgi:ABC-type sugar transport system ATPase subunit
MADVRFERLTKTYPDGTTAVSDFDLEVTDGEFLVLVGPSGCGYGRSSGASRTRPALSVWSRSLQRKPRARSGGQRQRVAMGRAIVRQPKVFLTDEPLSNLDAKLRVETRAEIAGLQDDLGVTTIYVTHDQVEAMTIGDRVAVMEEAIAVRPDEISARPGLAAYLGRKSCSASGRRTSRTRRPIELAVDIRSLHFFDPYTGLKSYGAEAAQPA